MGEEALCSAFLSKLTDCDGENGETDSSLDFARQCDISPSEQHHALAQKCAEIGRMLGRHDQKGGIVSYFGVGNVGSGF